MAKLDRLSRNVHFISGLMERKVDLVACDMPSAAFMIHVYSAAARAENPGAARVASCGLRLLALQSAECSLSKIFIHATRTALGVVIEALDLAGLLHGRPLVLDDDSSEVRAVVNPPSGFERCPRLGLRRVGLAALRNLHP